MILLVVLVIISVFALISVSFSYRMDAERTGVRALQDLQQARFAVDSGLARLQQILRDDRANMDKWYDNPDSFRRIPVWMPDSEGGMGGTEALFRKQAVPGQPCWRFSFVASERTAGSEDKVLIRYGVTDEASKVNINYATRGELLRLVRAIEPYLRETPADAVVDCLLDWREKGETQISPAGAKSPWYVSKLGYGAKTRKFESVEELLMVKNWNGTFLYGEDWNRNAYLDQNEDDGDEGAWPPDNGDGILNRGLLPFMTVYSWDWDSANDNKLRIDVNAFAWDQLLTGEVPKMFQYLRDGDANGERLSDETIKFLADAKKRKYKFRSIGEIWGLQVFEDGSTNLDDVWKEWQQQVKDENAVPKPENQEANPTSQPGNDNSTGAPGNDMNSDNAAGNKNADNTGGHSNTDTTGGDTKTDNTANPDQPSGANNGNDNSSNVSGTDTTGPNDPNNPDNQNPNNNSRRPGGGKNGVRRNQSIRDKAGDGTGTGANASGGSSSDNNSNNRQGSGRGRSRNVGGNRGGANNPNSTGDNKNPGGAAGSRAGTGRDGQGRTGDNTAAGGQPGKGSTSRPETDEERQKRQGTPIQFSQDAGQMKILMDRLTVRPPAKSGGRIPGLINANTAPLEVLRTIIGLTDEEATAIVARRKGMAGTEKMTPAWLVTTGAIKPATFAVISNKLTARSIQFTADVIGFADHVGTFRRVEAVIQMRGHMAEVKYYRDISSLGMGYPVKDDERSKGLAFKLQ